MIPGKQYTPELVLATAWRRKWLILIPAVVIGALSCLYTYRLPDQYWSATTILVVPQRVPENYVRSTVTTRIEDRLRSIDAQVRSRTRLEQVIQEFDLYADRRKTDLMQDIVDDMNESIGVEIIQSDVFRVSFSSDDPRVAKDVANKLAAYFIEDSLRERATQSEGTSRFLETELEQAKRVLQESEQKLAEYRQQHNGELPTQFDANLQALNSARSDAQGLRLTISQAREKELELERQVSRLSEAVAEAAAAGPSVVAQGSDAPQGAAAQLQLAKQALQAMLLKQTPDHPDVRRMRDTIAELERKVEVEAGQTPLAVPVSNPVLAQRTRDLDAARTNLESTRRAITQYTAQLNDLTLTIAQYQQKLNAAPSRDAELTDLTRNYNTLRTQYDQLLNKQLESRMSTSLERQQGGETFRIIDQARLPEKPSSPDRPRQYAMGLMLAIAVGLGLAGVAEYLDRGLRSEDDVRLALALPVLATIPVIAPKSAPKKSRKLLARFASAVFLVAVAAGAVWFTRG